MSASIKELNALLKNVNKKLKKYDTKVKVTDIFKTNALVELTYNDGYDNELIGIKLEFLTDSSEETLVDYFICKYGEFVSEMY